MKYILYTLILLLITGCSVKYDEITEVDPDDYEKFEKFSKGNFYQMNWDDLDGFEDDDLQKAFEVFIIGCQKSSQYKLLKNSCNTAKNYQDAQEFFEDNFIPYKLYDYKNKDVGIITGYYEPLLKGSRTKSKEYAYPIFTKPKDLIRVDLSSVYPELKKYNLRGKLVGDRIVPYDSRKDIKEDGNKDVIAYVNSKEDLYFLHIQGSGRVELDTGETINVGYADQNGRTYKSIGQLMISQGLLEGYGGSMQGMKAWFSDNPNRVDEIFNYNQSYIFFHESNKNAVGSLGVPLVAKRSLAVDRSYIPLGLPVFISTVNPITQDEINQVMIAADTGGAIKGEIRADFFWGFGNEAGELAGRMKSPGKLIVFLPKEVTK